MSFKVELDHIGVATPELSESPFFKLLGLRHGGCEEVPTEQVKVDFYSTANGVNMELLEPMEGKGPVAKFLNQRGAGIHHICFRVENIQQVIQHLKDHGVKLINEEPRKGAHGCQVVFVHPRSTGGVLVELSQKGGV